MIKTRSILLMMKESNTLYNILTVVALLYRVT